MKKSAKIMMILGAVVLSVAGLCVHVYTRQVFQTKETAALSSAPKSQDAKGKGEQPDVTNSLQPSLDEKQSKDSVEKDRLDRQHVELAQQEPEASALVPAKKEEEPETTTELTPSEFVDALGDVATKSPDEREALLAQVPKSLECVNLLKSSMADPNTSADEKQYVIKALAQIGTQDSVGFLLDQALAASANGDATISRTIMTAVLENPMSTDGAQELFDLLLGTGRYGSYRDNLPNDIRAIAREALRNAQDPQAVGDLAARLYLDPEIIVRRDALMELFDGVAAPIMLSRLSVQAYQNNRTQDATQFMDRLTEVENQGAIQAFAQMASAEPALVSEAAERLYAWSQSHPDQAQPGAFLEYLNDIGRPAEERGVAAYGMAGCADKEEADRILRKALMGETDTNVTANLQLALRMLNSPR